MNASNSQQLAELIHKKWQVLNQLCELGQKQAREIADGTVSGLLQLLSAKQHLLTALQLVDRQLAPYRSEDPGSRIWDSGAARERCAHEAQQCNEMLQRVIQLEREHELVLVARRDAVAGELSAIHGARTATNAYVRNTATHPGGGRPHSHLAQSHSIDLSSGE